MPRKKKKFDVLEHELVPKHEILSEEEKEEVLNKYEIKASQLPQIKSDDPAAKAIGAEPGDVLKITRKSLTAGKAIAYRYVV